MEKVWLVGTNWQQVQGQCEEAEEAGGQANVGAGEGRSAGAAGCAMSLAWL